MTEPTSIKDDLARAESVIADELIALVNKYSPNGLSTTISVQLAGIPQAVTDVSVAVKITFQG